jgi:hypothetical protein
VEVKGVTEQYCEIVGYIQGGEFTMSIKQALEEKHG